MPNSPISQMLKAWEQHMVKHCPQIDYEVAVQRDDVIKLETLAELYQLPLNDIIANLITAAIKETEQKMPYIQGRTVIRVEENDPVFEDIGRTPRYIAIKQRLEQRAQKLAS
ncbi:MAG: hypothetical protein V7707_14120 [Motiliproteus sp.]